MLWPEPGIVPTLPDILQTHVGLQGYLQMPKQTLITESAITAATASKSPSPNRRFRHRQPVPMRWKCAQDPTNCTGAHVNVHCPAVA